jgi:hypothetical protein
VTTIDAPFPASCRICSTCHFWGQDHSWMPQDGPDLEVGGWPGLCARKDQRTRAIDWCVMWSAP